MAKVINKKNRNKVTVTTILWTYHIAIESMILNSAIYLNSKKKKPFSKSMIGLWKGLTIKSRI